MAPDSCFIVIPSANGEPIAVRASDANEVRRSLRPMYGDLALVAATTVAALRRAGWTEETILTVSESHLIEVSAVTSLVTN